MLRKSLVCFFFVSAAFLAPSPSFSKAKNLELCKPGSKGCRSILMTYSLSSPSPVYGSFTLNGTRLSGWKYTNIESTFSSSSKRKIGSTCVYYDPSNGDAITFKANLKINNPRHNTPDHYKPFEYSFYADDIKDGSSRMLSMRSTIGIDQDLPKFEVEFQGNCPKK